MGEDGGERGTFIVRFLVDSERPRILTRNLSGIECGTKAQHLPVNAQAIGIHHTLHMSSIIVCIL